MPELARKSIDLHHLRIMLLGRIRGVLFTLFCSTFHRNNVLIGQGLVILSFPRIRRLSGRLTIGDSCLIDGTDLEVFQGACLTIGDNVSVQKGGFITAHNNITIGSNVSIAEYVSIRDYDHVFANPDKLIKAQGLRSRSLTIGSDVWIARGCAILSGSSIGDGVVVGANAVVKGHLPPLSVAVGAPARPIWRRTLQMNAR